MAGNKTDKSNMRNIIIESANQLKAGLKLAENIKIEGNFKNIIVCGMGGSALPAEILKAANKTKIPVLIQRDYYLPPIANENSLIICISYSGNTEETISTLNQAIENKLKIACISTGGKIEKICNEKIIPLVKIPGGIQPRLAIGYIFSSLIKILINSDLAEDISEEISKIEKYLIDTMAEKEKTGKKLSAKLSKKIPIIYSSNSMKAVSMIWKIKFNENSKIPAFYNCFPELNHNEMVGYTGIKKLGAKNFSVIILQDPSDNTRILKRMESTSKLIKKSGVKVEFVRISGDSSLQKIFSALLLGDWVSYYSAILQKIDPTPVKIVEDFKALL